MHGAAMPPGVFQELTPRPDDVYFTAEPDFITALKVLAGVSSSLSLIGAAVVILTYVFCELWPSKEVRHIIVMLSVADLLVAISHLWGIAQNIEKFLPVYYPINETNIATTDSQCTTQAAVAVFGTIASFLWTLALTFHIFLFNAIPGPLGSDILTHRATLALYNLVCWGLPFILIIILGRYYLLGAADSVHFGWCYVSLSATSPDIKVSALAALLLGYEVWTWLSLLGIILFSLCYVGVYRYRKSNGSRHAQNGYRQVQNVGVSTQAAGNNDEFDEGKVNWRLLLAAVLLVVLRSSQTLVDLALVIQEQSYQQKWIGAFVLFAVVGDSLQGFLNMFLFVLCTPQVYESDKCCKCWECLCKAVEYFITQILCCCCCK